MTEIMQGEATDAQNGAYMTALRMKSEMVAEITGSARVMRDKAAPIRMDARYQLDTCDTGSRRKNVQHRFSRSPER